MRQRMTLVAALAVLALPPAAAWSMGRGHGGGHPGNDPCPPDALAEVETACPCAGTVATDSSVTPWRNHGQYVRCVRKVRKSLRRGSCLTPEEFRSLGRCTARSTCGKSDKLVCCLATANTCDGDPVPGDGTAEGMCAGGGAVACDADADCTVYKARFASTEDACTARGGQVAPDGGSLCTACTPPAP